MTRTLRSKRLRALLWYAADGKCQVCGAPLGEEWEADHIVPWIVSQRTNVIEMQALCKTCNRQKGAMMSSWRSFLKPSNDFRDQVGQVKAFEIAASSVLPFNTTTSWLFEFVTGYGKTLTAYGMFAILKQRKMADRMLVLVPTDDQRTQFQEDAGTASALLGTVIKAWSIDKVDREFRLAAQGDIEVFVATYQQLNDGFFDKLLSLGHTWMVVADEAHHLGEFNVWAKRFAQLPNVLIRVGLTATPIRRDLQRLIGFPAEPTLRVTYQNAFKERIVKRIIGHIMHYYLDVDIDGKFTRLTTEQLIEEGVTDFSQYEAKRQLRYNDNYLNQMLIDPLQDLLARNSRHPGQNRMVVFCMTCKHAHHVCNQLNNLCKQLELPFHAEWIGVGEGLNETFKSIEENRRLTRAFKNGEFDILVQVGKAEEGFDVKQISVLLFLHLIESDGKRMQQIGRGLRRNSAIKTFEDDTVSGYASADTTMAALIQRMQAEANEVTPQPLDTPDDEDDDKPRQLPLFSIPDVILIDARYDRTDIIGPDGVEILTPDQRAFCERFNIPIHDYLQHVGMTAPQVPHSPSVRENPKAQFDEVCRQVQTNTKFLAGNIIKLLKTNGHPITNETAGRVKRAINEAWVQVSHIPHKSMTTDEFIRKNKWLQSVNDELKATREIPSWIRTALS